jgi:histidinol-phosphate aminotransferase
VSGFKPLDFSFIFLGNAIKPEKIERSQQMDQSEKNRWFRKSMAAVEAYIPGEQPRELKAFVKLNTNENPYPPSPVVEHTVRHFNADLLRIYPDPVCRSVRQLASKVYKVPAEQIFVANGSDEALSMLIRMAIDPGDPVVYPYPTYVLYRTLTQIGGGTPIEVDLDEKFNLPRDFAEKAGKLTFFARPNSPTGNLFDLEIIQETLDRRQGLVVVDEAYAEFAGSTALDLLPDYENLVVLRTLSKSYSLAGLRLGFAFASESVMEEFYRIKDSYNVDAFAQAVAYAALSDVGYMKSTAVQIIECRRRAFTELAERGFRVWPSGANFVFAEHGKLSGREIYEGLKEEKILVRYFNQRRLEAGIRITIGTSEQMQALYQALDRVL